MVTKCVVPNCGNSCNTKLSVTLFSFPKDPHLAQTWLKLTRAHGVKSIKSHHKVCSKHFERRVIQDHFGATRLEPGAIPTIFEWNNDETLHSSPFMTDRNPYLSFNEIVLPPPNHRLLLPKTPKVGIPPIVKRVSTESKIPTLDLFKKKALLGCDVILPDRRVSCSKKLFLKTQDNIYQQEEAAIEDIHRLSENVKSVSGLQVSDDDSNGSRHVGHHIEEYEENSLIAEINDPLHSDIDAHIVSRDGEILDKTAEEIIIEECSVIEDEIIPPERANDTLSPLFFLNNVEDVKKEESLRDEPSESGLSSFCDLPKKSSPPEQKNPLSSMYSSPKSECLGDSGELPRGIVFLQFDAKTGSCTENPNLNDLSQEELGKIKKSLSINPSSKVVILEKSDPVDKEKGGIPSKSDKAELPTKSDDSKKKIKSKAIQAKRTVSAFERGVSKSEGSKPLPTLRDGTTTASSGYAVPQASSVATTMISPLVLPKPQTQQPQLNSTASAVTPAQNVGSFLIATASSTPLANKSTQGPQVVGPMLLQIGNMTLPVTSSLAPGKPVQNNAVNLVSPQMTYLIPFGGALSSALPIRSSPSTNAGKMLISRSNQNVSLSPVKPVSSSPPKKRRRLTKDLQKLESDEQIENGACSSPASENASGRSTNSQEESLSKRLSEAEFELRRKSLCIKELRREKMRLSVRLKLLQKAFGKLRKASILTLSSARLLEGADPDAQLDANDLKGRRSLRKLDSFADSVHFASKRLYDHFRSEVIPEQEEEQISELIKEEPPSEGQLSDECLTE